ncbi:MAG: class I SAM-dependent methyltransferase [Euryarchaeota archaeon]|nr:class I SAM-dependent methyltransferase [Euryarchaeota archaeon]
MTEFAWPTGFPRIPTDKWIATPIDRLALEYDAVGGHGWYANLDHTLAELNGFLEDGDILIDYSGGTGILIDRLLKRLPQVRFGVINVDASPKFLRLSLEKFRDEPRVALRLLRYIREEERIQHLDEVLEGPVRGRGVDAIVCANAIHLYYELAPTLRSWAGILNGDGRIFIQSGNIRHHALASSTMIIDDSVSAVNEAAAEIVAEDERFKVYRASLSDQARMKSYETFRERIFLPPRPVESYVDSLRSAGLEVLGLHTSGIDVDVAEWTRFLQVYHEGVLGWVGGVERIEGRPIPPEAVTARLELISLAMARAFSGRARFPALWTYLTCGKTPH